ncbi:Ig-like domain-containing protein [Psychrosphaera sp. 1_MG-2023]|uniref:Ig-like domain-containing protein n=1 Tax=Psychrosphaera sp. 1_MG-2023 TaxID=3062643 RepID=UPI0026E235D4|nr:Ig-like domain-containing protein [Psychrosphaera sp. 1_MG-2023]MDO6718224.1 Ig-like domain-containing protein [Psychrosphaera sp. 1_MG-2023]
MIVFLKRLIHTSTMVGLCLIVMSCGGGENTSDNTDESSHSTADSASDLTPAEMAINATTLNRITFSPVAKIGGQNVNSALTYNAALLNATGNFKYPLAGDLFTGNVTVSVTAEDTDGIKRVLLGFSGTSDVLVVCEENCGTAVSTMVNGISPHLFGWQSGENSLQLWVEDVADNLQQVATVNINWQSKVITGVAASIDETTDTLNVNWDVNANVLRYNVYVTTEFGLTGQNYVELEGGDAKLSLTTNSASLTEKPIGNSYYILVTGIDGTGESAYSNTLLLEGDVITTAPIAVNDAFTVVEDATLNGNFMTNDTVFDDGVILANTIAVNNPSNGQVTINSDGSFSYVPNNNFTGTDLFTYAIFNENNQTSEASVTITVTPVNDAPTALDDNIIMTSLPFTSSESGVLANDNDVDGDTLTVAIDSTNLPAFGTVQLFSNGTFEYTPAENFVNYDRFGYTITDPSGATSQAIVEVTTPDFNGYPPITVNDQFQLNEDSLLVVSSENSITNNDFDEDTAMSEIILTLMQTTQNGTLLLASDGTFSYQPNPNFFGLDTFQYQLADEKDNATSATVELTVVAQNDIPTALNDSYKLTNDTTSQVHRSFGVLANDTDIDGDNINVDLSSVTQPSFGEVVMAENGSFSYTANSDFVGTDSFSYRVSDGSLLSSITTVSINVVDVIATTEDITPIEIALADISDQLPNNATLNTVSASNGTATFSNGVVQYIPEIGFDGIDNLLLVFDFEDGEFEVNLPVRVNLSNQAPLFISSEQVTLSENATINSLVIAVLIEDEDVENSTFTLSDDSNTFAIDQNSGQVTLVAPVNFEQISSYQISVIAEDPLGVTASQNITVSIIDVPEAPMITSNSALTIDEHLAAGTLIYSPIVFDGDNETEFTFTLANGGDAFSIDPNTGAITIDNQASVDFETSPTFNTVITVTDSTSLSNDFAFTISLLDVNEAPSISSHTLLIESLVESFSEPQATAFITIEATEHDLSDTLTWTLTGSSNFAIDAQTGEISIIANAVFDFETTPLYTLSVTATDQAGLSDSYDIQVSVANANEPPMITSDSAVSINENISSGTLIYTPFVTDGDNETEFTFALANGGDAFSIDPNTGAITIDNQASVDFETTPTFNTVITVTDSSSLSNDFAFTISLLDVNEAPSISSHTLLIESLVESFSEPQATAFITIEATEHDLSDTLTWTLTGSSNFAIDAQTGEISIIANAVFDFETTPLYTLSVTATDQAGLSDSYDIQVSVTNENEPPMITSDSTVSINENISSGTLIYTPVVTDGDNETEFTFALANGGDAFSIDPNTGAITIDNQASVDFETSPSFDTVITVSDASNLSTDFDLAITLVNVNEAPEITSHTMLIDPLLESFSPESATSFITFDALDVDAPDTLTWTLTGSSQFSIDALTGEISIIANAAFDFETTPLYTLSVTATDQAGLSDSYDIQVSVTNENEPPMITSDSAVSINENISSGTLIYTPVVTDGDNETEFTFALANGGDAFSIDPNTGAITIDNQASVDFETSPSFDTVITVSDASNLSTDFDLAITLVNVNEAPEITSHTMLIDPLLESFSPESATSFITFDALDVDAPDTLTWTLTGSSSFAIDAQTGEISIIANATFDFETTPLYSLNVSVTDLAGLTDSYDLDVSITNENEAPIAVDDVASVVNYDSVEIYALENDSDPEEDALSIVNASAENGSVSIVEGAYLVYIPNADITSDIVSYTVSDEQGLETVAQIQVTVTPLSLAGQHDINGDQVDDIAVTYDSDNDAWSFAIANHVESAFEIIDNKQYPFELESDNTSIYTTLSDQSDHNFGIVIDEMLYYVTIPLLDTMASLQIDFNGTDLTTLLTDVDLLGEFILSKPTYSGKNAFQRIAVNPLEVSGASITFDDTFGVKTGSYTYDNGQEEFTWALNGNDLSITLTSPKVDEETVSIDELLELNAIDQTTYDTYVANNGSSDAEVTVSIETTSLTLSLVKNRALYLDVIESFEAIYNLPSELGSGSVQVNEEDKSYRLYRRPTIGTYTFSNLSGNVVLPLFDLSKSDYEQTAINAFFDVNGSGSLVDLGLNFNWSINESSELEVNIENGDSYTFTKVTFDDSAYEVLISGTTSDQTLSAIGYIVKEQDLSSLDLTNLLTNNVLLDGRSNSQLDSFDGDGQLQTKYLNAHIISSISAQNAPVGMVESTGIMSYSDSSSVTNWAAQIENDALYLVQYFDTEQGLQYCDPKSDSGCYEVLINELNVKAYDPETNRLWVVESMQVLDFDSILLEEPAPTYDVLVEFLTYYTISPAANPVDDALTVNEEEFAANIDVLTNDLDSQNAATEMQLVGATAFAGMTSLDMSGQLDYSTSPNFNGEDMIQYVVLDSLNNLGTAKVVLTVTPVNDEPNAYSDIFTLNEGDSIALNPLANDVDIDGDTLTIVSFEATTNGTLTQNGDGTLQYTHNGSETTTDSTTYIATDGTVNVSSTIDFVITLTNDTPVAVDDTASLNEASSTTINVKVNDSDAESSQNDLIVSINQHPTSGTVTVNGDGTITYVHSGDETIADSFIYDLSDGELSSSANVDITITPVNDAPVAVDDDATVVNYSTQNFDVLINDTDADGDALTVYSATAVSGNVVIETDNTLTYTPIDNATSDTISYVISDGQLQSEAATVTITITPKPLVGTLDIDANNSDDIVITDVGESNEWQIAVTNVDLLFEIKNSRYYPVESEIDGSFDLSLSYSSSDTQFGAVLGDELHIVDMYDLSDSAKISADRVGTNLPNNFDQLPLSFELVQAFPISKDGYVQQSIGVHPRFSSGDIYYFERLNNTGKVIDLTGEQEFTWTEADDVITITMVNPTEYPEEVTASSLLDYNLITQTEYDNFVETTEDEYQTFAITVSTTSKVIQITDNVELYFDVDIETQTRYVLAPMTDFAGATYYQYGDPSSSRLYDKTTVGTYGTADLSDETWYLPRFEELNNVFNRTHYASDFYSDGATGYIGNLSAGFDWQIDSDGVITVQIDFDPNFENYTLTPLSESSEHRVVLVEATNTIDGNSYAALSYFAKDNTVSTSDILNFVSDKKLLSSFVTAAPASFDENGQLLADDLFSFRLLSSAAIGAPDGESEVVRDSAYKNGDSINLNQTDWTWSEFEGEISLKGYYDEFISSYIFCDPEVDQTCLILRERTWQVINIDLVNRTLWVVESEQFIDLLPSENEGIATYYQLISPRINHYQINDPLYLTDDTATAIEEVALNDIDVLSNDLDSKGSTGNLRIIGVSAVYGDVTTDGTTIDYTPAVDNNYQDTVSYIVADEYNQYDNATLTIDITPVNDGPSINSTPDTSATEAITWDYQISVIDVDDFDQSTDFTFTIVQGPAGMAVNSSGYVTWTPGDSVTTSGEVIIEVADGGEDGAAPVTQTFTITVEVNSLLNNISYTDSTVQTCLNGLYDGSTTRMLDVSYFNCDTVTTLDDLALFDNLQSLQISSASDWSELPNLDLSEFSAFDSIDIPDWSLLTSNSNLTTLTLYNVTLADWSFLTDLNLNYLNLDFSNLNDLSEITHMANLQTLLLTSNNISDWSGMTNFSLTHFSAAETSFSDLSLLASMTQMEHLKLYQTGVSDWSSLNNFNLQTLEVQNTSFSDLSLLSSMSNLNYLNISDTPTTDFVGLSNFQLVSFFTASTSFDDNAMSSLANSSSTLIELNINNTSVTDLSPLLTFVNLQSLHADIAGTNPAGNAVLLTLFNNGVSIHDAEDSDENSIMDFLEDPDGDGLINSIDPDDDNDGVLDGSDAYPYDDTLSAADDFAPFVEYSDYPMTAAFTNTDAYWFDQSDEFTSGGSALRSGVIGGNQISAIETTVNGSIDGGLLTFDWKVSSESGVDLLSLYVDGVLITSISGEQDWTQYQFTLTEGTHDVEWVYSKNHGGTYGGDDAGWLDNVNVVVYDINDAPIINEMSINYGSMNVLENSTSLFTATATDEEGDTITFSLSGTDAALFTIDSNAGTVSFTNEPNYEAPGDSNGDNVYEFNIVVTDDNANSESSSEPISISVVNAQEAPVFTSTDTISVFENATLVTTVVAADDDSADTITYYFSESGADSDKFNIDSTTGVLTFNEAKDYDMPSDSNYDNVFEVIVIAEDSSETNLSATQTILVTLLNLNEPPVISNQQTFGIAAENQSSIVTVGAYDQDSSDSITYSLSGTDAALLSINSSTGVVTFNTQPNFEAAIDNGADGIYEFTVTATDSGDGNLSDSISFEYSIANVNEAPVISTTSSGDADENQLVAFDVDATDVDSEDTLTYTISGTDAGLLTINSSTGLISFANAPNFETPVDSGADGIYDFVVTVTDSGSLQDSVAMAVTLNNINEAPVISTSDLIYPDENQLTVVDVDADDDDSSDTLTYSLTGTDASLLSIDSATGVVSFNTLPDFETAIDNGVDGTFEFSVTVTDDGTGALSHTVDFVATINNLNEPAVFNTANSVTVDENDYTIMTVSATDPESDTVTYAKAAESSDGEFFAINSSTGELTFSSLPNFEALDDSDADNIFIVAIEATEAGSGLVTTQNIAVTLEDVVENIELALDTTFNNTGIQSFNTFADSYSEYLVDAVQDASGNRYLALQSSDNTTIIVSKLNSNGYYDVSFGVNGIKFIDPNNLQDYNVEMFEDSPNAFTVADIKIDDTGRVYLAGTQDDGSYIDAMVIRLDASGQLDSSFSSDGKYVLSTPSSPSKAVDVLVHSAGTEIYALSESNGNEMVIESIFTVDGSYSNAIAEDEYSFEPVVLGENSSGNIIEITNNLTSTSIDVVEYDTSLVSLDSKNINLAGTALSCLLSSTNDKAYSLMQPDSSTLLIGGSTNCLSGGGGSSEEDALIVRLSADTLNYDTSFDGNGIAMRDIDGSGDDDPVISISQDSAGNIAFLTKTSIGGGNSFGLTMSQYEPTGILSSLSSILSALDLTQTSGSVSGVHAVVLQDLTDGTDKLTLISSRELPGETIELETYLVEYTPEVDTDLSLKIDETSFVYDFSPVSTQNIASALLTSGGDIFTTSTRFNSGSGSSYQGFSLHQHYLSNGLQNQSLIGNRYLGVIHHDGSDDDYYAELSGGIIELSDGSLAVIKAIIDDSSEVYSVSIERTNMSGTVLNSIETSTTTGLVDFGIIESVHSNYNPNTEEIIIYGKVIDSVSESQDSYIVKYDVSDPTMISEVYSSVFDVFEVDEDDYLTAAIILDDDDADGMGDVIAVGTAYYYSSESQLDAFAINVQQDGTLLTTFDGDEDNNHALELYMTNSNGFETRTMVKLSDDSLVLAANDDYYNEAYLVKLTHSGGGIYQVDITFDTYIEEGESADYDDYLLLKPLSNIGSGAPLNYFINDMAVDDLDNIYIVGSVDAYDVYGFVAKMSGYTGAYDNLFGGLNYPGFFIPAGRAACDYAGLPTTEIDICDVFTFEKIQIDNYIDGSLIIHGLTNGLEGQTNTTIMKFNEIVDDSPLAYDLFEPGA